MIQSVRATGGTGAAVTDTQIVDAIQLLAETEGIFTEPAGGTTLAATIDLIERGVDPARRIDRRLRDGQRLQDRGGRWPERLTAPVRLSRRSRSSKRGIGESARQALA